MPKTLRLLLLAGFLTVGTGLLSWTAMAYAQRGVEQPNYKVIKESDGVELRQYDPYIVAEVNVKAGSMGQASSRGFGPLADYIFGNNRGRDKIAMTAPVTTQAKSAGTKIAMTAPVTTSENKDETGAYTVRFSMPPEWTMETLPIPNNDAVKLVPLDGQKRVAYRFIGERTDARINEATAKIAAFIKAEGLEEASSIIVAGYDGPRVPTGRKRWEVMQIVR